MRAVTVDYTHRDLRERDICLPTLEREGDVLFRVLETGICGTDRELARFQFGYGPQGSDFLVLGHEALGEVVQSSTDAFHPGDLVVPIVRRACQPPCSMCSLGRRDLCITGRYTERGILGAHGYFTDFAVDDARDLVRVDRSLRERAVLIEPLSVVEKAVALALSLHQGEPKQALVLGAGTIGLLAGAVLQLRGLAVDLVSAEPATSLRARIAEGVGFRYLSEPERNKADIVIEAAGAPAAADAAIEALAPLGVLIILGAKETAGKVPLLDLIVGNRIVAGSVNASPAAFGHATEDLPLLPEQLIRNLIERTGFESYRQTISGPAPVAPKVVHVIA